MLYLWSFFMLNFHLFELSPPELPVTTSVFGHFQKDQHSQSLRSANHFLGRHLTGSHSAVLIYILFIVDDRIILNLQLHTQTLTASHRCSDASIIQIYLMFVYHAPTDLNTNFTVSTEMHKIN